MNICFIGNSHLAAVKMGWDEISTSYPTVSARFFGSPGVQIKFLEPAGDRLVAGNDLLRKMLILTSGGEDSILSAPYDAFVLVGSTYGIQPLIDLHRSYRADSHSDTIGRPHRVSDDLYDTAAMGLLQGSLSFRVIAKLREITDKPVYVLPQPAPSVAIAQGDRATRWKSLVATGDNERLAETLRVISARLSNETLTVLAQPEQTLIDSVYSRQEFARGAVALQDATLELAADDFLHMNTAYGVVVLRDLLARV